MDRLWEKTGAGGGGRSLAALRPRDFETERIANGTVGSNRQQHEIIGGSQDIGPPLLYQTGSRGQGLLHILRHSQGGVGPHDFVARWI